MKNDNTPEENAFFKVCQDGSLEDFDSLIAAGADPNMIDAFTLRRPIHVAVRNGNNEIVRRLVADKRVELDVIDGGCWTPMKLAEHLSYKAMVDIIDVGFSNRGAERPHLIQEATPGKLQK